jgi:tripartite-type tricarboxylate transporter receptor subunit TctC
MAVIGSQRAPIAPDVPTVREAGYPALEIDSLGGLLGPRGMALAVREQIAADIRAVVAADPAMAKPLDATGQVFDVRPPAAFAAGIKQTRDKLAEIAKVLGLKAAQ